MKFLSLPSFPSKRHNNKHIVDNDSIVAKNHPHGSTAIRHHHHLIEDASARTEDTTVFSEYYMNMRDEYGSNSSSRSSQDNCSEDSNSSSSSSSGSLEHTIPSRSLRQQQVVDNDDDEGSFISHRSTKSTRSLVSKDSSSFRSRRRSFSLSRVKKKNHEEQHEPQSSATSSRRSRSHSRPLSTRRHYQALPPKAQSGQSRVIAIGISSNAVTSISSDKESLLRCPHHPYVELARCSARTGIWKMLLDSCPVCNESSISGGQATAATSPAIVPLRPSQQHQQAQKRRSRSRSQSSRSRMRRQRSTSSTRSKQSSSSSQPRKQSSQSHPVVKAQPKKKSLQEQLQGIDDNQRLHHPPSSRSRSQPKSRGRKQRQSRSTNHSVDQLVRNSYSTIAQSSQSIRVNQRSISQPRLQTTRNIKTRKDSTDGMRSATSRSTDQQHTVANDGSRKNSSYISSQSKPNKLKANDQGTAPKSTRRFEKIEMEMAALAREKNFSQEDSSSMATPSPLSLHDDDDVGSVTTRSVVDNKKSSRQAKDKKIGRTKKKQARCTSSTALVLVDKVPSPSQSSEANSKNSNLPPEALTIIEDMRAENEALHQSMEEAMQLASGMNAQMATFVRAHNDSVQEYETKLGHLKKSSIALSQEFSIALRALKEENKVLRAAIVSEGENETEEYYEQQLQEAKEEKEDAYTTCEVLQREIDALQQMLEEFDTTGGTDGAVGDSCFDESKCSLDMMSSFLNMSGLLSCAGHDDNGASVMSKENEFFATDWLAKTDSCLPPLPSDAESASVAGEQPNKPMDERQHVEDDSMMHHTDSPLPKDSNQSEEIVELSVSTISSAPDSSKDDEHSIIQQPYILAGDRTASSKHCITEMLDSMSINSDVERDTADTAAEVAEKTLVDYPMEVDRSIASVWSSFYDDTAASSKDKDVERHPWKRKNDRRRRGSTFSDDTNEDY